MKIKGTVKQVTDTETVGEKGFQKRQIVVTIGDASYPQHIPVEFVQDKVDLLDDINAGEIVEIDINLRGREWNDKYYVSVQGWKINTEF